MRLRAPTGRKVHRLRKANEKSESTKKIRTDCEQSARISGTTPSGCACAHPPEEKSPDRRKARKKKQSIKDPKRLRTIGPNLGDYTHRKKSLPIKGRSKSLPRNGDRALGDPEPWRRRNRSPGCKPTPEGPQKKPGSGVKHRARRRHVGCESTRLGTGPPSASKSLTQQRSAVEVKFGSQRQRKRGSIPVAPRSLEGWRHPVVAATWSSQSARWWS